MAFLRETKGVKKPLFLGGGYFQKAMIELESKSRIEWMKFKSTWMLDILAPLKLRGKFFEFPHAWPVSLGTRIGPKSPPQQAVAFVEGSGSFLIFRAGRAKKGDPPDNAV